MVIFNTDMEVEQAVHCDKLQNGQFGKYSFGNDPKNNKRFIDKQTATCQQQDPDGDSNSISVGEVVNEGQVRFAAMNLLARREHSRFELREKLMRRFPQASELIQQVAQNLADEELQSDCRFAEEFIAMRVRKGQGPLRIEKELIQRGIDAPTIDRFMQPYVGQWPELAFAVWQRKYRKSKQPISANEKAKQIRFMLYRGFNAEHIANLWPR